MYKEILFAGFGGQGILFMGKNLAQAAMTEDRNVTYLPSYGPEMRSGTSNCGVIISDSPIASPVFDVFDILVVMNQPSYNKFAKAVRPQGILIYNSSLVTIEQSALPDIKCLGMPFTEIATALGNVSIASMVALGALVKETDLVDVNSIRAQNKSLASKHPELSAINNEALNKGYGIE